ncbi:hypothetical protein HN51_035900 [Arachis hypogaea]
MKKSGKMRRAPRESASPMSSTTVGVTFPSFIRVKFKINKGMKYCIDEAQSIAYIFRKSMNPSEMLFKRGDMKLEREDFYCLQPGQEPSVYIMQLMAYKTSWTQSQLQQRIVWSLPLHFSEFILDLDIDGSQVVAFFFRDWLPRPAALRYIYIQMADKVHVTGEDHFYLVVVDINGGKMWLMDCYPTDDSIIRQKYAAKVVMSFPKPGIIAAYVTCMFRARTLDYILKEKFSDLNLLGRRPPLAEWNPEFVLGIPNMGNCYKDKLWVLLWLQMEQYFTLNPIGKKRHNNIDLLADKIRIDTALGFATEHFNQMRDEFLQRTVIDWNSKRTMADVLP